MTEGITMGTRDEPCIQFHDECSCQIILETKVCHCRFAAGPVCVKEDGGRGQWVRSGTLNGARHARHVQDVT